MAFLSVTNYYHVPSLESLPKVSSRNMNPHPEIADGSPYIEGSSDPPGYNCHFKASSTRL